MKGLNLDFKFPIGTRVACQIINQIPSKSERVVGTVIGYDVNDKKDLCYVVKSDNGQHETWWKGFTKNLTKLEQVLK